MSDVLIKNMKLPSHCTECDFWHDGVFGHCLLNMEVQNEDVPFNEGEYPIGCPLVPVPPHGRLIDADKLIRNFQATADDEWNKNCGATWSTGFLEAINMTEDAPTIIPAEEGE